MTQPQGRSSAKVAGASLEEISAEVDDAHVVKASGEVKPPDEARLLPEQAKVPGVVPPPVDAEKGRT